jgi:serine protease AprX
LDYILDKVIVVGAANTQGTEDRTKHKLADFSSIGDSLNKKLLPTVLAPGVDMMVYSYEEGNRPKELVNGTSFASPYVSGVVALMNQANPKIKPAQVRDILKSTAVKLANLPDTYQGFGEVDPHAAVDHAKQLTKRKRTP